MFSSLINNRTINNYPDEPQGLSEKDEMLNEKNQYEYRQELEHQNKKSLNDMKRVSSLFVRDNYVLNKEGEFVSDIWEQETNNTIEDVEAIFILDNNLYSEDSEIMITDRELAQNVFSNIKVPKLSNNLFLRPDHNWEFELTIYTKNKIFTSKRHKEYNHEQVFIESPRY